MNTPSVPASQLEEVELELELELELERLLPSMRRDQLRLAESQNSARKQEAIGDAK